MAGAPALERTLALLKPDATGVPWFEGFSARGPPPGKGRDSEALSAHFLLESALAPVVALLEAAMGGAASTRD